MFCGLTKKLSFLDEDISVWSNKRVAFYGSLFVNATFWIDSGMYSSG